MSDVVESLQGPVLTLTINREAQRNSLSAGVIDGLLAGLERANTTLDVRVVVLTGAGAKAFCAGGDLGSAMGDAGFLAMHDGRRRYGELLRAIAECEKPTIARVNGLALAGGLGLVCACDLAIATVSAQFGTPEVNVGLFPYMVTAFLFRAIPTKPAMELVLTGRRLAAEEAARIGLVNRVVPDGSLDAAVTELATELAGKSPAILRLGKRAMRRTQDIPLDSALELLASQLTVNSLAEDAAEGVSSFLEKRPPVWKGR